MKRILIFAAILFMANSLFAGSVLTQRVVRAQGFLKGSTTISLSGELDQTFMDSLAAGNGMAIYNYLDSYLTFPILLPKTKGGYGTKSKTQSISVSTKNGKFSWTEKDVTPYFAFASGFEKIKPLKATFKSSGTLQGGGLDDLSTKKFVVFDFPCNRQGLGYLGSLAFSPEKKGKNYKFTYKENNWQVKVSANAKGKATASYKLPPDAASPAFVTDEYVFTNLYDYTFEQIGEGTVEHGFIGPDQVELQVTENNDKFRYFLFNGEKITNDYLLAELKEDSEFTAVFGTYDLTVNVVGSGFVGVDYVGPDNVNLTITEDEGIYRYALVDGEKTTEAFLSLNMEQDTEVTVVFGTYDLSVGTVGDGTVEVGFVDQDEAEVRIVEQGGLYRYALVGGVKTTETSFTVQIDGNTDIIAVFGQYALSVNVIGEGSVTTEFVGADEVEVTVCESEGIYRFTSINGEKNPAEHFTFQMVEDTEMTAVFGTYDLSVTVVGEGTVLTDFVGPDEVNIAIGESEGIYRYSYVDDERTTETSLTLQLEKDTQFTAVFGTYDLAVGTVGDGSVEVEFVDQDKAEVRIVEQGGIYRYALVGGEKTTKTSFTVELDNNTDITAVFGQYALSVTVIGEGSVDYEFIGADEVEVTVGESEGIYRFSSVNGVKNFDDLFNFSMTENTELTVVFGTYNLTVDVVGSGFVGVEFIGPDEVTLTAENDQDVFSNFTWGDNSSNYNPLTITLTSDTTVTATFKEVTRKYLVIDISGGPSAASWPYRYTSDAPEVQSNACKTTELWLRYIPAGTFSMGSPESEYGRGTREVAHEVTLTKDFYIGVFELTVKQYELITGDMVYGGDACPVVDVVYDNLRGTEKGAQWPASDEVDENSFMGIIRAKTGLRFDLPTEAQWEYACRATTVTAFNNGKNLDDEDLNLAEIAYYNAPSSGRINVGSRKPNLWGLYDMHGNVWEWCLDWYTDNLGTDPVVDPVGQTEGYEKTLRGGSFNDGASACRSAYRAHTETDHNMDRLGFRPVVNQ